MQDCAEKVQRRVHVTVGNLMVVDPWALMGNGDRSPFRGTGFYVIRGYLPEGEVRLTERLPGVP
jgi:hypothetical protein